MSKFEKLVQQILSASADKNICFEYLRKLLLVLDFKERIKGSHHIYYKTGVEEIINLQPLQNKVKPYQVKQVREIINKYKLIISHE